MATPKPGEIRCPTCHRSTPPAAFCTQCGSAIPTDARIRPRGMDRDELQERIRARRSGGEPYRRGGTADDDPAYERFEPEPEDARIQRGRRADAQRPDHLGEGAAAAAAAGAAAESPARGDLTRDRDDWTAPVVPPPADARGAESAYAESAYAETVDAEPAPYAEPEHIDAYEDGYADPYAEYPYEYDRYEDSEQRSSGAGAFAILGFLALGVLALFGGAVLAGVFGDDDPGVGSASPTPTFVESIAPEVSDAPASAAPSVAASPGESAPAASGEPVTFPDGFTAEAQPCLPGSVRGTGCNSNGAVNGGTVDIWVGFREGTADDVVGATIIGPDGSTVGEGTIALARIGCTQSCNGYTYFNFRNLSVGTYQVRVTRNGDPASETSFEVS
jgi:hypothetical protein